MAQTTNALSAKSAKVYLSTNGSTWTDDISGEATSIESTEQSRISGEAYTFDGDTAIITSGKREPIEITVNTIYTEESADTFETVRALFEAAGGSALYLRWQPAGNTAGDFIFSTSAGVITNFSYPPIDASGGNPILCTFTLKVASVTKTAVAA